MENLSEEEIAEFREIFSLVDKDGGGSITGDELGELMDTLGIEATPEEINGMIAEVDKPTFNLSISSIHIFHLTAADYAPFSMSPHYHRLMQTVVER